MIGLLVGLLVGGGFFILKLDDYFKELSFYRGLSQKQEEKTEEKIKDQTDERIRLKNKNTTVAKNDSAKGAKMTVKSTANLDIVVKKDELLIVKQVDMINLSSPGNKDSLLQELSGIKDDQVLIRQSMNVEFWLSPINYKGYKMAKNKVVLFGIATQEDVKLYKLDENSYLKLQQGVYKLEYTNDFKQMEPVNEEAVLTLLK